MVQIKEVKTWEFGDFQTPTTLAQESLSHLKRLDSSFKPKTIIEPTCGIGAFLITAANSYPEAEQVIGLDVEASYLNTVRSRIANREDSARFNLQEANFFQTDWEGILSSLPEPFLIVGNPPWVTSADIGRLKGGNIPKKTNFQKYKGFEAVTGKSNFDISEWMLIQNLKWIHKRRGCLAMLCKTSVARKILLYAWKKGIPITKSRMVQIDAKHHFSAAVDACFFSLKINDGQTTIGCEVFDDFEAARSSKIFGYHEGMMLSRANEFYDYKEFLGKDSYYTWRSGVKHDCSKVMELRKTENGLVNGHGEIVNIESLCVFPLLKSSDLGNKRVQQTRLEVIVTQQKVGQATDKIINDAPKTWQYLVKHASALDGRKSSIYRNKPRFSIFGVGDYTFTDWKVAISGFYKRLDFQVIGPMDGKPVIFDDTIYCIGTKTKTEAIFLAELLNSRPCQKFLESMIFWSDKRPITIDLLKRVNLEKVAQKLNRSKEYKSFTN